MKPLQSARKPEVLIAIESLGGGGAERMALELARHWPREHERPVMLVASRTGRYLTDLPDDLPVLEVGVPSSPRRTLAFLSRLRQILRGRHLSGVVSHMTGMNRMLIRAAFTGVIQAPVVVVEHNDFKRNQAISQMPQLRSLLLRAETSLLYRHAHAVVGCSQGVAQQAGALFGIAQDKLHAIVNPLDRRFLQTVEMDHFISSWFERLPRPIFVSVGRMVPQKAFDDLIRAFKIQNSGSLVILGEGPQRGMLESLVNKLGVADRVMMPGFIQGPQQVLQAADVYVSSSLWEGYPLTLIEAYASGLPVVARACNFGPAEIVTPDRPGRLVESLDVADLANAMRMVAASVKRFPVGTVVDLSENDPVFVAQRYRALFANG
jgi:glycosyltransferase involved in cell wall biosynthesis